MHLFITGTDTNVGKTYFTQWLLRAWRARGYDAAALKPICTGGRDDAHHLREAGGGGLSLDEINPVHFQAPAAPLVAANAEGRMIDFPSLNESIRTHGKNFSHLAVEGVGGWRVPLAPNCEVRDWARELGWPVVVVARTALGTLNHTLLTVESIHASGLTCAGIVLNPGPEAGSPDFDLARLSNHAVLHDLLGLPILELDGGLHATGEIPIWLGGK